MLISDHADGRIISRAIAMQGFETVTGSTGRGGVFALKRLLKLLKGPMMCAIGITPDGPRGPRGVVSSGTIFIAQKSGACIIPISYQVEKKWVMKTWDQFIVPKPFNKITFLISKPISCCGIDADQAAKKLESALNQLAS